MWESDGHGLVASVCDIIGKFKLNDAKAACEELFINGYSDWYLPSKDELEKVYEKLYKIGIGRFMKLGGGYWSSTKFNNCEFPDCAWHFDFYYGKPSPEVGDRREYYVRAVRSF